MSRPECPKCKVLLRYVQRVYEYHVIEDLEDGEVDLKCLDDSSFDDLFAPYLWCHNCEGSFNLEMEPIPSPRDFSLRCKFCNSIIDARTAHAHDGGWVGDECCWIEALRGTE